MADKKCERKKKEKEMYHSKKCRFCESKKTKSLNEKRTETVLADIGIVLGSVKAMYGRARRFKKPKNFIPKLEVCSLKTFLPKACRG